MNDEILSLLAEGGILSQKLERFEPREAQIKMLADILEAFRENKVALIEAGTGTGKSLAYLLPALFWVQKTGEKTVVSTNTIALQEQLVKKDLPLLLEALGLDLKAVLVKGMNNYLCLRKLEEMGFEKKFLQQKEFDEVERIEEWAESTSQGSKSELKLAPSYETWEKVCAESESCTHVKCPHYKECFFFKARKEAADAHLIVANHHLLFADLNVRQETNNYAEQCILPHYSRLILDEAHHVEDVATEHFAKKVSRFSLFRLLNRLSSEKGGKLQVLYHKVADLVPEHNRDEKMSKMIHELGFELPHAKKTVMDLLDSVFKAILEFRQQKESDEKFRFLEQHQQDEFWKKVVQERAKEGIDEGRRWLQSILSTLAQIDSDAFLKEKLEGILADLGGLLSRLEMAFENLVEFVFSQQNQETVRWIEVTASQNIILATARLDIADLLKTSLFDKLSSVVLCSATLAAKKQFNFIRTQLGIKEALERLYDSPFDYQKQSKLFVPLDMPHPDHADFPKASCARIFEAIEASQGGTFVLFTSWDMLQRAKHELQGHLKELGYRLFCQGEESTHGLLAGFRNHKKAVLFGTDSFWEGVDVVGEALRCVIIVKLPFLVPSDPLFQAKSEKMVEEGKSPFFEYSLPQAAMKFKQGFGRLIRSKSDRGCVLCLDTRLVTKGYGKIFLGSLPALPHCFDTSSTVIKTMKEFYKTP